MQLTAGRVETYKTRAVFLSYYTITRDSDYVPTLGAICDKMYAHFVQEFSLYVETRGQHLMYRAADEDAFQRLLSAGAYDTYQPTVAEVESVLATYNFPYFDFRGEVRNSVLEEVW